MIRFYNIKDFIKLLKSRHLGHIVRWTAIEIAWNIKDVDLEFLVIQEMVLCTNFSDKFVAYGPPWTKGFYCYGDKMVVIP